MATRVIAEIKPAGDFPIVSAENVGVNSKKLDKVLEEKVEKVNGKELSTNDYSDAEKAKVKQAGDDIARLNGYFTLV